MLLIIDNESEFIREFEQTLDKWGIEYLKHHHAKQINFEQLQTIDGIILSGGPGDPYHPLNLSSNYVALINFDVPIMGICLGHEILAAAFGGNIEKLYSPQDQMQEIIINSEDSIFEGLKDKVCLQKKHENHVSKLPKVFKALAYSKICPLEIIKHRTKPIYGFQSHPEVSGKDGLKLMQNFLRLCGLYS